MVTRRLRTDIVVIGADQAGLSSAYHLKRLGVPATRGFLVLDQSPDSGGAWQFRWPSLTLSTVNRIHDLPGLGFAEAVVVSDEVEARATIARRRSSWGSTSLSSVQASRQFSCSTKSRR